MPELGPRGLCGEHGLDKIDRFGSAIQQIESGFPGIAGQDDADHAPLVFQGLEFIFRQGEAVADEQSVDGRDAIGVIACEAAVFGAAPGLAIGVAAGNFADGRQKHVQMGGEDQAEEVMHVTDVPADRGLREAGAFGEGAERDARGAEFGEHGGCGVEDVGPRSHFPRRWFFGRAAGLREGEKDAGGDRFHEGTMARRRERSKNFSRIGCGGTAEGGGQISRLAARGLAAMRRVRPNPSGLMGHCMRTGERGRIDLKKRLMLWALLLSGLCLGGASAFLLVQAGRGAKAQTAWIADLAARALQLQAQQASWVKAPSSPPDAEHVASLLLGPGMCLSYSGEGGATAPAQHLCAGAELAGMAPGWFARPFVAFFAGGIGDTRTMIVSGRTIGTVRVDMDAREFASRAWHSTVPMLGDFAALLLTLCILLYFAISIVLAPTILIRDGLRRLAADDLTARLPPFDLGEISDIGTVFNRLAVRLQEALAERDALLRQIVTVQDEERRALARDLHDEFGQCLAGTAALLAAMRLGAARENPVLAAQCDTASAALATMMAALRDVLLRLRPPELEALGLDESLRHMIAVWNGQCLGRTVFGIEIHGDTEILPRAVTDGLYRVAQEALTNAARHANAARIDVQLDVTPESATLLVEDDGIAACDAEAGGGFGVLGMRERMMSLGGDFTMLARRPRGVAVTARVTLRDRKAVGR